MRTIIPAAILSLLCGSVFAAEERGTMTITVHDLASDEGRGVYTLYSSASDYHGDRPLHTESLAITNAACAWITPSVPPGDYIIRFYHDRNGNGRLDRTTIGIPREPVAFSNNTRPRFGPPRADRMVFSYEGGEKTVDLHAFQALGPRGRFGVGVGGIVKANPYDTDAARFIAIPMISYMGDRLSITGPVIAYLLATPGSARLSAYLRYSFEGFDVDDAEQLEGMHDRNDTVVGGLRMLWKPWRDLRIGGEFGCDVLGEHDGQEAELTCGYTLRVADVAITPGIGLEWLSEDSADHLYGVRGSEATPARPAYEVGSAVNGMLQLGLRYSFTDAVAVFGSGRWTHFDGDICRSPIVVRDDVFSIFFALAYSL